MEPNPNKRQVKDLLEKAEKIGELLNLEKVPTFCMTWKERRLDLPGGGECYPLIDVLERLAEMVPHPPKTPARKKPGKKKFPEGTTEV